MIATEATPMNDLWNLLRCRDAPARGSLARVFSSLSPWPHKLYPFVAIQMRSKVPDMGGRWESDKDIHAYMVALAIALGGCRVSTITALFANLCTLHDWMIRKCSAGL